MKVVFTSHAKTRMLERGINEDTVKDIIFNPDYVKTSFDKRKIATRKNEQTWHIIYREEKDWIVVITLYSD